MRILVAADGSSHANRALDFAARLAKEVKGVEVTLINVGHIPITESPPIGNPGYVDYGAMEEALERAGRQILEDAAKPFAANDMRVTPLYRFGGSSGRNHQSRPRKESRVDHCRRARPEPTERVDPWKRQRESTARGPLSGNCRALSDRHQRDEHLACCGE